MPNSLWPTAGSTWDSPADALLACQLAGLVEGFGTPNVQSALGNNRPKDEDKFRKLVRCSTERSVDGVRSKLCSRALLTLDGTRGGSSVTVKSQVKNDKASSHSRHPVLGRPIKARFWSFPAGFGRADEGLNQIEDWGTPLSLKPGDRVVGASDMLLTEARLRAASRRLGCSIHVELRSGGFYFSCMSTRHECDYVVRFQLCGTGKQDEWEVSEVRAPQHTCDASLRLGPPSSLLLERLDAFKAANPSSTEKKKKRQGSVTIAKDAIVVDSRASTSSAKAPSKLKSASSSRPSTSAPKVTDGSTGSGSDSEIDLDSDSESDDDDEDPVERSSDMQISDGDEPPEKFKAVAGRSVAKAREEGGDDADEEDDANSEEMNRGPPPKSTTEDSSDSEDSDDSDAGVSGLALLAAGRKRTPTTLASHVVPAKPNTKTIAFSLTYKAPPPPKSSAP
ncbi:hypothetical protein MNV49_005343 [Pseudohyphozyma bogoriensis]|nr:hypothetical protein MNV49_005343 [Pseudohyphozyma bogoriensis]